MNIELNYTPAAEDFLEMQRLFSKKGTIALPRHVGWIVISVAAIILFLVFRSQLAPPERSVLVVIFAGLALYATVEYFTLRWSSSKTAVGHALNKHPDLSQPRRVYLADDGLTLSIPTVTAKLSWTHFATFAESDHLFILITVDGSCDLFPKRAFPSPEALNEFRSFAQAHIGNTPIGFPVQPPNPPPQSKIEN